MREADRDVLIAMVEQHEGNESARFASDWLARQPDGVTVYRDEAGEVVGFIAMVALQRATAEERNSDPATRLAWNYVQHHARCEPVKSPHIIDFGWLPRLIKMYRRCKR